MQSLFYSFLNILLSLQYSMILAENVLTFMLSKMYMSLFLHQVQISRNLALHHMFTNESYTVNGCRRNESLNN